MADPVANFNGGVPRILELQDAGGMVEPCRTCHGEWVNVRGRGLIRS